MCVSVSTNLGLGVHAPGSSRALAGPGAGSGVPRVPVVLGRDCRRWWRPNGLWTLSPRVLEAAAGLAACVSLERPSIARG